MSLSEISAALWRERNLLEMLLFKLDEVHLLLASGDSRWLAQATKEVEAVLDELRMAELLRACLVEAQSPSLGLGPNVSLRSLALEASTPWNELLGEHRTAFLALTHEISSFDGGPLAVRSDPNLRHRGGERRCDRFVDHRAKQPDGQYGVKGDAMSDFNTVASVDPPETILDLELHDTAYEVLLAADRVIPRSLMDFLR